MDKERIENAVREILLAVGEDPNRPGLLETPKRVANMYEEIFAGLTEDPKQHIKLFDEVSNDEMVIVKDIPFYSFHNADIPDYNDSRDAFAELIDKVSGKGTWESNPYVFAYEFELID